MARIVAVIGLAVFGGAMGWRMTRDGSAAESRWQGGDGGY